MMHHESSEKKLIAQFTAFLSLVARNARLLYLRQVFRYKTGISIFEINDDDLSEEFETQYAAMRSKQLSFEFEEERLARAFAELPGVKQQVLKHIFIDDMETGEIACRMGIKEGHVRLIKHRAIQKLKKMLLEGGEAGE